MFGVLAFVLLAVILVCYRVLCKPCRNRQRRNIPPLTHPRRICPMYPVQNEMSTDARPTAAIYLVPIRGRTISDPRDILSIYSIPVHSNTTSFVREDSPPPYQDVIHPSADPSDSFARL